MKDNSVQKTWFQHNPLAIMSYLSLHSRRGVLYGVRITEELGLSQGSVSMIRKEIHIGREDLAEAEAGLSRNAYKGSTIQAYYGIFHGMRALLFASGYRDS